MKEIRKTSVVVMDMFFGWECICECWSDYNMDEMEIHIGHMEQAIADIQNLLKSLHMTQPSSSAHWVNTSKIMEWEDHTDMLKYFNKK